MKYKYLVYPIDKHQTSDLYFTNVIPQHLLTGSEITGEFDFDVVVE